MKNRLMMGRVGKCIVCPFRKKELCKCIGYVLSKFSYGKKGHKLWSEIPKDFGNKPPTEIQIYVCGNTNLYKVCCDLYRTFYIYDFH